ILGRLRELAIEPIELPPHGLLLLGLAIESLELALALLEQAPLLLLLWAAVRLLLALVQELVFQLLAPLRERLLPLRLILRRALQRLAHLLELRFVELGTLLAQLLGEIAKLLLGVDQVRRVERLPRRAGELRLLHLFADLAHRLFERFRVGLAPFEELVLERLHPPERLGGIEALLREVFDELIELLRRRLRLFALIAALHLFEELAHRVDVVRRHVDRFDRLRRRRRLVLADLENGEGDHREGEAEGRAEIARRM